jgi:hypothetical protein
MIRTTPEIESVTVQWPQANAMGHEFIRNGSLAGRITTALFALKQ